MSKPTLVVIAALAASCGSKPASSVPSSRGGAARGPVMVFVGLDSTMMFEALCHAPDCDALRARALDGTQVVSSNGSTYRITGTVSDNCDASGATDVVGLEKKSGPEDSLPGVITFPDGAPIDLQTHTMSEEGITVSDEARAALARLATADLRGRDNARAIAPGEITVEQVVQAQLDGDGKLDTLVAANVPLGESDGPGYVWSALVLVPGSDYQAATSLWVSDLEHLWIDATLDVEGDGVSELIYSAAYYEGGGQGAAMIKSGKLEMLGQWGCGA